MRKVDLRDKKEVRLKGADVEDGDTGIGERLGDGVDAVLGALWERGEEGDEIKILQSDEWEQELRGGGEERKGG